MGEGAALLAKSDLKGPAPSNRSPKWRVGNGPNRFQLVTCEVGAGREANLLFLGESM